MAQIKIRANMTVCVAVFLFVTAGPMQAGSCQAATCDDTPWTSGQLCSISGLNRIPLDTNDNGVPDPADGYWEAYLEPFPSDGMLYINEYGPATGGGIEFKRYFEVHVRQLGAPIILEEFPSIWVDDPTAVGLKISKDCGGSGFNRVEFIYPDRGNCLTAAASLADKKEADGMADTIEGYADLDKLPPILIDFDLQSADNRVEAGGQWYLKIPKLVRPHGRFDVYNFAVGGGLHCEPRFIGGSMHVFVPVDTAFASPRVTVKCGTTDFGHIDLVSPCDYPGPAPDDPNPCRQAAPQGATEVPALSHWGFILLALFLLITGIAIMRRCGMGDGFTRN